MNQANNNLVIPTIIAIYIYCEPYTNILVRQNQINNIMKGLSMVYENEKIKLEEVSLENVDLLIEWTLDPNAQGEFKTVPKMSSKELKSPFMDSTDRSYFLIRTKDDKPIGRFYYRRWLFSNDIHTIDWELNIFIAIPEFRGKGYGSEVHKLAIEILEMMDETNTIFAYTMVENIGERRVLEKCGFDFKGSLHNEYYKIDLGDLDPDEFVLYARDN